MLPSQFPGLDYREGTWTPVVTFATPGNMAITYANQLGYYKKIGNMVVLGFAVGPSAFTQTTAAGNLIVTGIPFPALAAIGGFRAGVVSFTGITKAGYGELIGNIGSTSLLQFLACGFGQANSFLGATDLPSGTIFDLRGSLTYFTA